MASKVGIVNHALRRLGVPTITAFADSVKAARMADDSYDDHVEEIISEHTWNFALKRVELPASTTSPVWEYTNAFPVPSDSIRMLQVDGEDEFANRWRVEEGVIVTNKEAPLKVVYLARIDDPNAMTARFRNVVSTYLAWQWAEALTGDATLNNRLEREYRARLVMARSFDGQEGTPRQPTSDRFIDARFAGRGFLNDVELGFDPGSF